MGMFHKIRVGEQLITPIDWEMTPDLSFGTFESWGGRERVRNNCECVYYFFIDNWGDRPKLYLMERAVKHAKIVAEIIAPREIMEKCVEGQGSSSIFEKSYAIDSQVKQWLIANVLDGGDSDLIVEKLEVIHKEDMGPVLPRVRDIVFDGEKVELPKLPTVINDEQIGDVIGQWNFYDTKLNQSGAFTNVLAAGDVAGTIVDLRTSLMWQQGGLDIGSARFIDRETKRVNEELFAGHADWRLPTMEEALSLMETEKNDKGLFLAPCFSKEQPFIFVAARRKPGGYWFVDYKQGRAFWSSGTIPGGFGRLVRTVSRADRLSVANRKIC